MLRYHTQGASALALAVAFVSLNVSPGKAQEGRVQELPTVVPPEKAKALPPRKAQAGPVHELPTVEVEATNEGEGPGSSQAGAGLGGRFTGYTVDVNKPAVAGKDKTPIIQAPFSIQVVPRQVIDDQQDISVQDAILYNVSSVQPGADRFFDGFTIRGFDTSFSTYRNNLRVFAVTDLETANLQSIEVLKGPAAMLFGRLEPGGIVNLVVKRPLLVPYYSIQEQAGSWGLTRTTVDATGPITDDKTWLYRVNLDYTHTNSFRNFVTNQNAFIGPTITYNPIEQFRFNLDAEYQNTIFVSDSDGAIPAIGTRPAPIPISRYLMDPAVTVVNPNRQERKFIGYDWTFDIAKDWSLTNRFAYINVDYATNTMSYTSVNEITGLIQRRVFDTDISRRTISSNLDLNGKFSTGPLDHAVLVGTDYFSFDQPNDHGFSGVAPTVGPVNLFAPTYRFSGYVKPPDNFFFARRELWKGVYAQDFVSFADDRLHLLFGGRSGAAPACGGCGLPCPQGRGQTAAPHIRSRPRARHGKLLRALCEGRGGQPGANCANTGQRRGDPATSDPGPAGYNCLRRAAKCQRRFLPVDSSLNSGREGGRHGQGRLLRACAARVEETRTVYLDQYSGKVGDVGFSQYGPAAKAIEWGYPGERT